MKTPLTYYGGKQRLASQIMALMPAHRVYLEPFAGGAAVLFAKPRVPREALNDLDGEIMAFWRALRERPEDLARAIELTPYSRREWNACRRGDVAGDDIEAARRLLVDIDQSFGRARSGWSPPSIAMDRRGRWQPGVWENMPAKLIAAADRLRGVALEDGDALDLIPRWDQPDTVIYVDPPYTGPLRLTPEKGYRVDDDGTLWDRLVEVLAGLQHAYVLLSGYPCEQTIQLGWRSVPLTARRAVQELGNGTRGYAPESLWLSPNVPDFEPLPTLLDGVA